MAFIQLNPPIPLLTPKGKAQAQFVIDYGPEFDLLWVCFQDDTGECWTWSNPDIRIARNITMGRENISPLRPAAVPAKPLRQV
ncbi:MAG: hypothetical protein QOJ96_3189 [Alphaproteobacteria bacterium]|jgi:hypothetical protein|nr:hypothetical protein [Alphaproteobacteria bacterium]